MAKDPAFPFYTQDFLTGTMFFTDEEVGIYMRLLCAQHQLGGLIAKNDFEQRTKEHPKVRTKFIETEDGYYNQRLMSEMAKREKKSTNLSDNAKKRWLQTQSNCNANAKQLQSIGYSPLKDEDENENEDENEIDIEEEVMKTWNLFASENGLAEIKKLSSRRRSALHARFREREFDFPRILEEIRSSAFLCGNNENGWQVDFDFVFLSANNYLKILEGKYRDRKGNGKQSKLNAEFFANLYQRDFGGSQAR